MFSNLHLRDISAKVRIASRQLAHGERGLETVEWALMIIVIALVVIIAASNLGSQISNVFQNMVNALGG
ncbi:MAG: hypothetical protein QGG60_09640 [Anaerolineales bacterium]|jgi:Flp pilus assembly pilin Flp|nr:Flp family type IVb pilin [Dehalococcoidales bacterium]MDP7644946.1 hypothetical protein [Anaerolineales bacterium]|tara:strand:- start:768 stop:974 length:207 start_codon:yes stop_codon:yes gene_type:complete